MDFKRKKCSRMRGSKTHGGGSMKKRRGAGHRGGRGAAGSGKRGDAKKPSIWRDTRYAGRYGFNNNNATPSSPISLHHLESFSKSLIKTGVIVKNNDSFVVDLSSFGYTKLLGNGKATKKWVVTVATASASAIEKIKNAGGSVNIAEEEAVSSKVVTDKKEEK